MSLKGIRILQLIDTLDPGGAERMAVNLANSFQERGVENLLVVSRSQGDLGKLVENQNSVRLLGKKKTVDQKAFRKLLNLIDEFKPHLIHAHGTSVYWAAGVKLFRWKIKIVWHDHLGISEDVILKNPRKELNFFAWLIDFIITANESTRDFWIKNRLKPTNSVQYLPNFPHLKVQIKPKPDVFTFLHLANFRTEKGQLNLLKASKILKQRGSKFKVRMVGQAVDKQWKQEVEKETEISDLSKFVSVEGAVSDVAGLLSEVHAGLVASDREGLPVALLEYGLASLPVISTKVGQCPEVLGNGEFGFVVDTSDFVGFADAMQELISNPGMGIELGKKFNLQVKENYGEHQFFSGYEDILHKLVES
ncbi:MAG: glycosyltransferase family 4 protein [Algoriphagus sp.]|nr:glycosyltransferase family 4 protein [Algoriphagus sp.]